MRVFAAAVLSEQAISGLDEWLAPFRREYSGLKWVKSENLHLTLRFFGNIDEKRIEQIREMMLKQQLDEIRFTIEKSGTFGRKNGLPSIYWVGGKFGRFIYNMAEGLGKITDDRGDVSERRFSPHLTIARRKRCTAEIELPDPPLISGKLTEVVIFNSTLTGSGTIYDPIEKFRLK